MQLKQSLNILNMSKLELEEEIKREYEENPLLEVEKSSEVDWEKYIKNIENSRPSYKNELYYNYDIMFLKFRNKGVSLEHKRQHWTKNQN